MKEGNNPSIKGIPPTEAQFLSHETLNVNKKEKTISILRHQNHQAVIDEEKYKNFFSHKCLFDEAVANTTPIPEGDMGSKYTYSYTEATMGTGVSVKCRCGAEEDITDYDSW